MSLETLFIYIKITFSYIDKNELKTILEKYGYVRESLSPEFLLEVGILYPDFLKEYALLVEDALANNTVFQQDIITGAFDFLPTLDKASGDTSGGSSLDWFKSVSSFISSIGSSAASIYATSKGAKTADDVAYQQALLDQQAQKDKAAKTTLLVVGGVVAVVLIVVMIFAFSGRKK